METKVKVSLEMPYDTDARLRLEAAKRDINRSEAIRRAIALWLGDTAEATEMELDSIARWEGVENL